MRTLAALVLAAAVSVSVGTPAHAAPQGNTKVIANCTDAKQTPRKVVAACADLNSYAVVPTWDSWTGHQARGSGTWVVNDCRPDCASGTFRRYPATFSLHQVVTTGDGTRLFSRLGVTYLRGGEQRNLNLALPTAPLD